jgi:hypothetical protein
VSHSTDVGCTSKEAAILPTTGVNDKMKAILLASTMLAMINTANAADIKHSYLPPVAGATSGAWYLNIVGDIEPGDDTKFYQEWQKIPSPNRSWVNVYLKSGGGDLKTGLSIGKMVRDFQLGTMVEEYCASVCALIWLADTNRGAWDTAPIGFHAAYYGKDGAVTPEGNALVGAYLHSLGFTDEAIIYLTQTQPNSIEWLTS